MTENCKKISKSCSIKIKHSTGKKDFESAYYFFIENLLFGFFFKDNPSLIRHSKHLIGQKSFCRRATKSNILF
jgi:hypothetical protein